MTDLRPVSVVAAENPPAPTVISDALAALQPAAGATLPANASLWSYTVPGAAAITVRIDAATSTVAFGVGQLSVTASLADASGTVQQVGGANATTPALVCPLEGSSAMMDMALEELRWMAARRLASMVALANWTPAGAAS